jgi:hypothetical protein
VHLVEGKLLGIPSHGFEETRNQLDNIRHYADRLWAVFPESQWRLAHGNHDRWNQELRDRGYGLLLVNENTSVVIEAQPAQQNRQVEAARKSELLEEIVGPQDEPVGVPSLGTEMGKAAAQAVARVAELMAGPVKNVLAPKGRDHNFLVVNCWDSEGATAFVGDFEKGAMQIQGDPFDRYLEDGRPVIWVWHNLGDFKVNEAKIRAVVAKQHPEDACYYADNDADDECRPVSEVDIQRLKDKGYVFNFAIGRALTVDGRSKAAVKKDLQRLLLWQRELARGT